MIQFQSFHRIAFNTLFTCFIFLAFTSLSSAKSSAKEDQTISDLSQAGWERDKNLLGIKIDRYKTISGSLTLDLMAFPVTQKSAAKWLDEVIIPMTAKDRDAGLKVHILNNENNNKEKNKEIEANKTKGDFNSSSANVDIATRSVMVVRPGSENKNLFLTVRALVRKDKPVQFSILTLQKTKATKTNNEERKQANKIRFDANLPLNQSAAFLGRDAMVGIMTEPLIYPNKVVAVQPKKSKAVTKTAVQKSTAIAKKTPVQVPVSKNKSAKSFSALPGPNVRVTGKMLGSLPAGYRMQVRTTNYWTSGDMTSTRQIYLSLTKNGQFEFGNFSINGGMGGFTSTIHSSDKKGSVGTVYGNTNPGGSGARSVALSKKTGLDGSKYGTYYISGHQIEFAFANGKIQKRSFQTDGYKTLLLNQKKFFVNTPDGWERRDDAKAMHYRSLNGAYLARVITIKYDIDNSRIWMERYISKLKAKNIINNAGPIKTYKGGYSFYNVAKSTMIFSNKNGKSYTQDIFLKNGRSSRRLIQIDRLTKTSGDKDLLTFIKYLN